MTRIVTKKAMEQSIAARKAREQEWEETRRTEYDGLFNKLKEQNEALQAENEMFRALLHEHKDDAEERERLAKRVDFLEARLSALEAIAVRTSK